VKEVEMLPTTLAFAVILFVFALFILTILGAKIRIENKKTEQKTRFTLAVPMGFRSAIFRIHPSWQQHL